MSTKSVLKITAALVGLSSALTIGASAQDATLQAAATPSTSSSGAVGLETVVVTARKREENLITVPVAVAVVSSTEIADTGVKDLKSLSQFTPGLFVDNDQNGHTDRSQVHLTFRGLSSDSGSIFIDGAPYTGTGTPDITDIARVEVLTGPQSVYFGRSTFSGAVNFVTAAPSNVFKGQFSEDLSTWKGTDSRLTVEGPLLANDLLNARLSLRRYSFGGQYVDGVDTAMRLGTQGTNSGSIALSSAPFHGLNLSAYYSLDIDDDGPAPAASIKSVGPGATFNCNLGGTGGPYFCGQLPTGSGIDPSTIGGYNELTPFVRSQTLDNPRGTPVPFDTHWLSHFGLKRQVSHWHVKADYATDSGWDAAVELASNSTKLANLSSVEGRDTANVPNPFHPATPAALAADCAAPAGSAANLACSAPPNAELTLFQESIVNDFSTDVRVSSPQDSRLRATVGASYYEVGGPIASNFGVTDAGPLINGGGGGLTAAVNTPAIYGGVYFDVTDALTLNVEARYQWDGVAQQQLFPVRSARLQHVFTSLSPRFTVNYKLSPDSLVYATVSQGYKPGGFNPALLGLSSFSLTQLSGLGTNISFKQEKLTNYEIGHKATWFDNRLRTTLALYAMNWANGQVTNGVFFTQDNGSTASVKVTENVGSVLLKGVELTTDFAATDNLLISGTLDYADNKIKQYVYTPNGPAIRNSTNVNGNSLDNAPKLNISLSPSYTAPLWQGWDWFARVDYNYRSKMYIDPTNVAWIGARNLVNLHLGVIQEGNFKFETYVNNLLDDDTLTEGTRINDGVLGPSLPCPPCTTAASPPITSGGVSALSEIPIGLPVKRTFGVRGTYSF